MPWRPRDHAPAHASPLQGVGPGCLPNSRKASRSKHPVSLEVRPWQILELYPPVEDAPDHPLWLVKWRCELLIVARAQKSAASQYVIKSPLSDRCRPRHTGYDHFTRAQRVRLTFARSMSCVARPSRTAFIMNMLK